MHLLCLSILIVSMCYTAFFNTASHFMAMSVATKINFLGLENFVCCSLHLLCPFKLIVLMSYIIHLNSASHFMALSVATKINFLGLDNFCMLYIASTLPFPSDRFEVLYTTYFNSALH